jgi:hypothetical protein
MELGAQSLDCGDAVICDLWLPAPSTYESRNYVTVPRVVVDYKDSLTVVPNYAIHGWFFETGSAASAGCTE